MHCRLLVIAAATLSCGLRAHRACESADEGGRFAEAAEACARSGRDADAGRLAWALLKTGHGADASKVIDQRGAAPGLLQLSRATLDWRAGKGSPEALERARDACGDSLCIARAELELNALHSTRGDLRSALADATRALAQPATLREPNLHAQAQLRLFDLFYELGDAESAARVLGAIEKPSDPTQSAALRLKQGNLRALQGQLALAGQAYLEAADDSARAGWLAGEWSARLNLVKEAAREGRAADARAQLALAEALAPRLSRGGNSDFALHFHRALVLHAERALPAAMAELQRALDNKPGDEWRWELELERALVAHDQGDAKLVREACLAAIDAAERSRAALGFDELKTWLFESRQRPFALLFQLEAERGDALAALRVAERAFSRTFLDAFVAARGPAQADGDALARADFVRGFLPALQQSKVVAPAPLEETLRRLGARHALVWFGAWLVEVVQGKPVLHRLAGGSIDDAVARVLRDADDAQAAAALGELLLPPEVDPRGELYLVATGPLTGVPFAALRRGGRALVQDAVLHYAPSLGALAAIADGASGDRAGAAVLADARGDLRFAREEAAIAGRALSTAPLLGAGASREALRNAALARTLHLAVHGGLGVQGAWLQLADGDVTGADVLRARLRPRLAVLASCASAATRARELWGSMGAAFLAAGSGAVLASLWSVDDAATRALAERFYLEGGADDPAQALARTQRALAAAGAKASSWAAFVVLGE